MQVGILAYEKSIIALAVSTVAVLGVGVVRGETSISSFVQLRDSQAVLSQAVGKLRSENSAIADEISRLKDSPSYARKVLRDKYHVMEEDEDIVFFAE